MSNPWNTQSNPILLFGSFDSSWNIWIGEPFSYFGYVLFVSVWFVCLFDHFLKKILFHRWFCPSSLLHVWGRAKIKVFFCFLFFSFFLNKKAPHFLLCKTGSLSRTKRCKKKVTTKQKKKKTEETRTRQAGEWPRRATNENNHHKRTWRSCLNRNDLALHKRANQNGGWEGGEGFKSPGHRPTRRRRRKRIWYQK